MFAESMIETSWAQRTQRSWTTLTSFGLQMGVLAVLLTLPLLRTTGLPESRVLQPLVLGVPPALLRPVSPEPTTALHQSNLADNVLIAPPSIPRHVRMIDELEPPPQISYNTIVGGDGAIGNSSGEGVWKSISGSLSHVAPPPVAPHAAGKPTFRTSSMLQGTLIRRVEPGYPLLARTARIQGPVILAAIISKAGTIEHLQVLSGHPMLVNAALEAVGQWRYRPYVLNGEVIEVETQITVNFKLN